MGAVTTHYETASNVQLQGGLALPAFKRALQTARFRVLGTNIRSHAFLDRIVAGNLNLREQASIGHEGHREDRRPRFSMIATSETRLSFG